MKVSFLPLRKECEIENGMNIMEAAAKLDIPIDANCSGAGVCGKCKVRIVSGSGNEITDAEMKLLTETELASGFRLACMYIPDNDAIIETINVGSSVERKASMMKLPEFWKEDVKPIKKYITIAEDSLENQASKFEKIKTALDAIDLVPTVGALSQIALIDRDRTDITVTVIDNRLVAVEAGNTENSAYGIAFDIGTTTVVGILWNLNDFSLVGTYAQTNPQGAYGADVISRITYISQEDEKLDLLQSKVIECLNGIARKLCQDHGIDKNNIYRCTVDGNTTMSHIFAGIHPHQLALAPYTPVFCDAVMQTAKDAGIDIMPEGDVYLMPNIAGHVGSDITAGIISTDIMNRDECHLMIDIGTNGEIVLAGKGKAFTCSTAAGPAFEGASISKGMRAASGAIETVVIEDGKVHIETIDNEKPIGICGSGIIDAVGQLVKAGIVNKNGKILKAEKLAKEGFSDEILSRVRTVGKSTEFVLYEDADGEDICITQLDIREVQLAKAAIYAGIQVLMENLEITAEELERISIAGAFGSYIDIDNALNIGLLPDVPRERIFAIGNAAGVGVSMAVLSDNMKAEAERSVRDIKHIELAALDDFQDKYIKATLFS